MIDNAQVEYIANLARLKLSEREIESFAGQLGTILDYVDQLNKVETENVEPTCFVVPDHDPLREDKPKDSLQVETALKNGPKVTNGYFAIPKVIG